MAARPHQPAALLLCLALCACSTAFDPSTAVRPSPGATARKSWKAQREQNVVMQKHDYSCGGASLATLLRFYFGDDRVTEQEVILEILNRMTPAEIEDRQRGGLSLLDLRDSARRRGYTAEGLKLDLADLEQLDGPVLVHMIRDDLPHFVILRGVRGDKTFVADPSYGNLTLQTHTFAREWTGYVLCVDKEGFTAPADHPLAIDAAGSTSAPGFNRGRPAGKSE